MALLKLHPPIFITGRCPLRAHVIYDRVKSFLRDERNRGYRVRFLDEDCPLYRRAELSRRDEFLELAFSILPADGHCDCELAISGTAQIGGIAALTKDGARARAALEKRYTKRLRVLEFSPCEVADFEILRNPPNPVVTKSDAERQREIIDAHRAGLISAEERDRMLRSG